MKVDFHTHSQASPDGSLSLEEYNHSFNHGNLDYIAITDHNTIDFAVSAHQKFGDRIIIGEEITTKQGELIGLYLNTCVEPHQTAREAATAIKKQGGLVYVPHPFETVRSGITLQALEDIKDLVDIVEVDNGRAIFQNFSAQALAWANETHKVVAAGSDAHGAIGWGRTYTEVLGVPTKDTLIDLLVSARRYKAWGGLIATLYPKLNRLRKKLQR